MNHSSSEIPIPEGCIVGSPVVEGTLEDDQDGQNQNSVQ